MKYDNIEGFYFSILNELKEKKIDFNILKNTQDKILIEEEVLNSVLKTFFNKCTKSQLSFTILKDEYKLLKIDLFDINSNDKKRIFIYTCNPSTVNPQEKYNYLKSVARSKKQRIFPVVGPDGVGKTTLLTNTFNIKKEPYLYKRFKKIVRRSFLYNILYPINRIILKRKLGVKPLKDQHDDIHYLMVITAGIMYYPYLVFNSIFRKKVIFLDRFFNDYLLENISFLDKKTKLRENWKTLLKFIPTSYWMIHLDAKAKVILNRKNELTSRDIKKYRKLNFKMYLEKPSIIYTYINTSRDLELCKNILSNVAKEVMIIKKDELCKS